MITFKYVLTVNQNVVEICDEYSMNEAAQVIANYHKNGRAIKLPHLNF